MFMSERTIKIAYISAAQTGQGERRIQTASRVVRRDWMAASVGAWRRGQTVAASVTNLCAIARLNGVVY